MFQTATDANVGGRNIGVRILTTRSDVAPGGQGVTDSCYCDIRPNNTVAANLIQPWTAYQGSTIVGPSGGLRASLPFNLRIQPGHWIQSSTLSFSGAGDEYSGIRLLVQEWIYEL